MKKINSIHTPEVGDLVVCINFGNFGHTGEVTELVNSGGWFKIKLHGAGTLLLARYEFTLYKEQESVPVQMNPWKWRDDGSPVEPWPNGELR